MIFNVKVFKNTSCVDKKYKHTLQNDFSNSKSIFMSCFIEKNLNSHHKIKINNLCFKYVLNNCTMTARN